MPEDNQDKVSYSKEELADWKHLQGVQRHIKNVQSSCNIIAERLIDQGEISFALHLLRNSQQHDVSKLVGVEWKYLRPELFDTPEFKLALEQHQLTNEHHPECWGDIKHMPRIHVAEMVADWNARSMEFGTDLRDWIKNQACKKYNITPNTKVYKTIKEFVDLLLEPPFSK